MCMRWMRTRMDSDGQLTLGHSETIPRECQAAPSTAHNTHPPYYRRPIRCLKSSDANQTISRQDITASYLVTDHP